MSFDAVFHALSESGIKKIEDNFLDPFLAKILLENSIFFIGPSSVYSFSLASWNFQTDAIYTVR